MLIQFIDVYRTKGLLKNYAIDPKLLEALYAFVTEHKDTKFDLDAHIGSILVDPVFFPKDLTLPEERCTIATFGKRVKCRSRSGNHMNTSIYDVRRMEQMCTSIFGFVRMQIEGTTYEPELECDDHAFVVKARYTLLAELWYEGNPRDAAAKDYFIVIGSRVAAMLRQLTEASFTRPQSEFFWKEVPYTALAVDLGIVEKTLGIYSGNQFGIDDLLPKFESFPKSIPWVDIASTGANWMSQFGHLNNMNSRDHGYRLMTQVMNQLRENQDSKKPKPMVALIDEFKVDLEEPIAAVDPNTKIPTQFIIDLIGRISHIPGVGHHLQADPKFVPTVTKHWLLAAIIAGTYFSFRKY